MDAQGELLVGVAMLAGLAGVFVPVLPGLLLIWAAAFAWAWVVASPTAWAVFVVITTVCALGTAAKYVLPGRSLREAGAPWSTMAAGALGAVVGFFVIPFLGVLVGAIGGVFVAELNRLHDRQAAWRSTWATIKATGVGMAIELLAAVLAVVVWVVGLALT